MFATGAAAVTSTVTAVPAIMQQQVEGGEVAGHDQCQAEKQACDMEAEDQSEQEESVVKAVSTE